MSRLSSYIEQLRFAYGPRLAQWLVDLSTWTVRRELMKVEKPTILVDNTVLGYATTHETAWISTGRKPWGESEVDTGYTARVSVYPYDSTMEEYDHIRYLPGLLSLHRRGFLKLYTSAELRAERLRKPAGMFSGFRLCDYNLFASENLESVDGAVATKVGERSVEIVRHTQEQHERLTTYAKDDPEYAALIGVLGQKNSLDAWHIRTAELFQLAYFLTMDFSILKSIRSQAGSRRIKNLRTIVITPMELGKKLGLQPVPPSVFSYTDASFFVRSDLAWPDGKQGIRGRGRPRAKKP
jgi:hypothetical protein